MRRMIQGCLYKAAILKLFIYITCYIITIYIKGDSSFLSSIGFLSEFHQVWVIIQIFYIAAFGMSSHVDP